MLSFTYTNLKGETKRYSLKVEKSEGDKLWGRDEAGQLKSFFLAKIKLPEEAFVLKRHSPAVVSYVTPEGVTHTLLGTFLGLTEDCFVLDSPDPMGGTQSLTYFIPSDQVLEA